VALDPTRTRLLEAAGREFAEKGFEGATVRSISERAGANLASVNYHFGDKERLYEEAVLHAHACSAAPILESFSELRPAEALRHYIHHFLINVVALRGETWHHALMLREMITPTKASETLVREAIRPRFDRLTAIIRRICPDEDERRIQALALSVVGQCLHYKMARTISERLVGAEAFARLDLEYLSDHIARFTLAALGQGPTFGPGAAVSGSEPATIAGREEER